MSADEFWKECREFALKHGADGILSYMYKMREKSAGVFDFTRDYLRDMGRNIEFFPGVETWFDRVNAIGNDEGVQVEHYIISSGVTEIIKGSAIGDKFKAVFAASFAYDDAGHPVWPAAAVNYTSKTQYLFRINKGILDVTNDRDLNAYTPQYKRRIPFSNMVYIGDGLTDVPCMKMTRQRGGYSIAVHPKGVSDLADDMLLQSRADFAAEADYSAGSEMESIARALLHSIKASNDVSQIHARQMREANARRGEQMPLEVDVRGGLGFGEDVE